MPSVNSIWPPLREQNSQADIEKKIGFVFVEVPTQFFKILKRWDTTVGSCSGESGTLGEKLTCLGVTQQLLEDVRDSDNREIMYERIWARFLTFLRLVREI